MADRVLRVKDLININGKQGILNVSASTFHKRVKKTLPPIRFLGGKYEGWLESDIDKWLQSSPTIEREEV